MMGFQAAPAQLFYDFCLDDHVPCDHLLRGIDGHLELEGLGQTLKPFCSRIGRPSIDPELTIRMLIVGHCMGIRSERRLCDEGPPQSGVPLVSLGGHGLSTPLVSAGQMGSARKGSGFFACSTPGGVGGQDGLRRIGRPSSATRPGGKCRTVATSDAGFFRRAWVVNSVGFGWPGGKRSEGFRLLCVLNARRRRRTGWVEKDRTA